MWGLAMFKHFYSSEGLHYGRLESSMTCCWMRLLPKPSPPLFTLFPWQMLTDVSQTIEITELVYFWSGRYINLYESSCMWKIVKMCHEIFACPGVSRLTFAFSCRFMPEVVVLVTSYWDAVCVMRQDVWPDSVVKMPLLQHKWVAVSGQFLSGHLKSMIKRLVWGIPGKTT